MAHSARHRDDRPERFADVAVDRHTVVVRILTPSFGTRESMQVVSDASAAMANLSRGLGALVLDLTGVRFMNSSALGACLELRKRAATLGAGTALVGRDEDIRQMFDLMRVEHLFIDADDLDSARSALDRAS